MSTRSNRLRAAQAAAQSARSGRREELTDDQVRRCMFRKIARMLDGELFGATDRLHPESIPRLTEREKEWVIDNWSYLRSLATQFYRENPRRIQTAVKQLVQVWNLGSYTAIDPDTQVVSFHPAASTRRKNRGGTKAVGDHRFRQEATSRGLTEVPWDEEKLEEIYSQRRGDQ